MVEAGAAKGLVCFGTGDHNHNLTAESWQRQQLETLHLKAEFPEYELMNNCEITFRFGHALVLRPKYITGTINEGLQYIFKPQKRLQEQVHEQTCEQVLDNALIINHPYLPSDRWRGSLLTQAQGIEVVNGSVLRNAEIQQHLNRMLSRFSTSLITEYPHAACYADYLEAGIAVLPFGSSDAHTRQEMGTGVTGYAVSRGSSAAGLDQAAAARKIFAATDTAIALIWDFDEENQLVFWEVVDAEYRSSLPAKVQWFKGRRLVSQSDKFSGRQPIEMSGFYWMAYWQGTRFAVSAPVTAEVPAMGKPQYSFPLDIFYQLFFKAPLSGQPRRSDTISLMTSLKALLYCSKKAVCRDAAGKNIPLRKKLIAQDVMIDSTGGLEKLNEVVTWLDRNEMHEFTFLRAVARAQGNSLQVDALLLPSLIASEPIKQDVSIRETGRFLRWVLTWHRQPAILQNSSNSPLAGTTRLDGIQQVRLHVSAVSLYAVELDFTEQQPTFPLMLEDPQLKIRSRLMFDQNNAIYQYDTVKTG